MAGEAWGRGQAALLKEEGRREGKMTTICTSPRWLVCLVQPSMVQPSRLQHHPTPMHRPPTCLDKQRGTPRPAHTHTHTHILYAHTCEYTWTHTYTDLSGQTEEHARFYPAATCCAHSHPHTPTHTHPHTHTHTDLPGQAEEHAPDLRPPAMRGVLPPGHRLPHLLRAGICQQA